MARNRHFGHGTVKRGEVATFSNKSTNSFEPVNSPSRFFDPVLAVGDKYRIPFGFMCPTRMAKKTGDFLLEILAKLPGGEKNTFDLKLYHKSYHDQTFLGSCYCAYEQLCQAHLEYL